MKSIARVLLTFALMAVVAVSAGAADKKPADKKPPAKKPAPYANLFTFPKVIKLDDKQKDQVEKLRAEYAPKLTDLDKKREAIMTADRVKAAQEARKKASDAILTPERVKAAQEAAKDKKGKERTKAYQDALKLTADEKKALQGLNKVYNDTLKLTADEQKQLASINKDRGGLMKEINTKKLAILTDEQKEAIKPKPKKKPAGK
jgi:hypothetical protein